MTKKEPRDTRDLDDARAFQAAMGDARRLTGPQRVRLPPAPSGPGARHKRGGAPPPPGGGPDTPSPFTIEEHGEEWTARANGIDRALLKKLSAGKIAVEAKLDLHGQSKRGAGRALERFFSVTESAGARTLLLVHGRGLHSGDEGATLRETVRDVLTRGVFAPKVLAAASAPPSLGGTGATIIWLRRPAAPFPSD